MFYPEIGELILVHLPIDWPEIRYVVGKFVETEPEVWKLPMKGFSAIRKDEINLNQLCAAFGCSYMAIMLVDDMLDSDARGAHNEIGEDQIANMAIVLNACSDKIVQLLDIDEATKLRISHCLQYMMFETGYGQYLDSRNIQTEESYWRMIRQKSAPFFTGALKAGAIMAGATEANLMDLDLIGQFYGEILQIHDDLSDCFEIPATPDWLLGRSALPLLFATTVDHPEKPEFVDLLNSIEQPGCLERAQQILVNCGAVSYCMHEIMQRSGEILG